MASPRGIEPAISGMRARRPCRLDDGDVEPTTRFELVRVVYGTTLSPGEIGAELQRKESNPLKAGKQPAARHQAPLE